MRKKLFSLQKHNKIYNYNNNLNIFSNSFLVNLLIVASLIRLTNSSSSSSSTSDSNSTLYDDHFESLNSTNNLTSQYGAKIGSYFFVTLILIPIIICTIVGNLLVVLAVVIVRKLHTQDNANNFLIVSLAVSDFLVGLVVMPFHVYVELSPQNK